MRKAPDTVCLIFTILALRSARLLSKGTRKSYIKAQTCGLYLFNRSSKFLRGDCFLRPRFLGNELIAALLKVNEAFFGGVILREREHGKVDQTIEQASGGRLKRGKRFYFFESGRTRSYSTVETAVGDTARTLATLRSFTLPGREFYFDRVLEP